MAMMIAVQVMVYVIGVAMRVCFYAATAYWVARMAHRGWKAGK